MANTKKRSSSGNEPAYVVYGQTNNSKQKAIDAYSGAVLDECVGISPQDKNSEYSKAGSNYRRNFSNLTTNVSGRPGLVRDDFTFFRPETKIPSDYKGILQEVNNAYRQVGIIKNMIDLMSEFGAQGIRLSHRNRKVAKFYKKWFDAVGGQERSERFLNILYRLGTVIITRKRGKISKSLFQKFIKAASSDKNPVIKLPGDVDILKREIPVSYRFVNPATVEPADGVLSILFDEVRWNVIVSDKFKMKVQSTPNYKKILAKLSPEVRKGIEDGVIPLDPNDTITFFYKKDDWEVWGTPMLEAILDNIILLRKLMLADLAALDGATSKIRIFKLGDLDNKIMPTRAAAAKLASILQSHTGVGTMDLIWGPDINLIESETNVHNFLGNEKYTPTLQAIHSGLGIPGSLTGGVDEGGKSLNNNFVSLKTLIERLNYGRQLLREFWEKEIIMVQRAMGFRYPAIIEFDYPTFSDGSAEKALLIQLADRNLISDETLHQRFGISDSELEQIRIKRENDAKDGGDYAPKAGPWHDPQFVNSLKKIALQQNLATPSQVGLILEENKDSFEAQPKQKNMQPTTDPQQQDQPQPQDQQPKQLENQPKKDGQGIPNDPMGGRPKNSKDKKPRKQRAVKPVRQAASVNVWARNAQNKISSLILKPFLHKINKPNLRKCTAQELLLYEKIKFGVLVNIEPMSKLTKLNIVKAINKPINTEALKIYNNYLEQVSKDIGRNCTLDEQHIIQLIAYNYYIYGDSYAAS